jgi:lipoyl-dependent peroxiredoxin
MAKTIYEAEAHVEGGRDGHAWSSDGGLDVKLQRPGQLGSGVGTNPEQLFAAGYAACFASAVTAVATQSKQKSGSIVIDSRVALIAADDGTYRLGVNLAVGLPEITDPEVALDLVRRADQACPYSNAIRGNVDVGLSVNGRPVASVNN